jgi:phage baseplate assembly protein W
MTPSRYNAWRFAFRDIAHQASAVEDLSGGVAGLAISPRGGIATVGEGDSIRQAILMLVCTRPGERVMRPEYGCYLYRLAFAPNDDTTAGLAIHYVRQAIGRWEKRIEVLQLDANRNPDHESRIDVHLQYRLRVRVAPESLSLALDLRSGRMH